MRRIPRKFEVLRRTLVWTSFFFAAAAFTAAPVQASLILLGNNPVATSASHETSPTVGQDAVGFYVAYTSQPRLASGTLGLGSIQVQRLRSSPTGPRVIGAPTRISEAMADSQLPAADGDYVLYTAFDPSLVGVGVVMLYQMSTGISAPLSTIGGRPQGPVREGGISGLELAWIRGAPGETEIAYTRFDWLGTPILPFPIAGPVPAATNLDVGDRFVVWDERVGSDRSVISRDLGTGTRVPVAADPTRLEENATTSGPWVTWESREIGGSSVEIFAKNLDTGDVRTVASNGAHNLHPKIDGDFIVFESDAGGNYDLWGYQLSTGELSQLTHLPGDQYLADVAFHRVAWVDDTSGNPDIFVGALMVRNRVGVSEPPLLAMLLLAGGAGLFVRRRGSKPN